VATNTKGCKINCLFELDTGPRATASAVDLTDGPIRLSISLLVSIARKRKGGINGSQEKLQTYLKIRLATIT
jgi:hypothetical protein